KPVGIDILVPEEQYVEEEYIVVGFGVYPDTSDPNLVKINLDKISNMWVAFVDGVIYFHAYDDVFLDDESRFNLVISFDLKSEKVGEARLRERLEHATDLDVMKVNESLGLLEYYDEGGKKVCGVWSRKDGANNPFTKIYTIKVEGKWLYNWVLGFRNNGEVLIKGDDGNYEESRIDV
ncbi:ribonuclease H-like domain-containing protein, partial [Tanacetum coccineum]